MISVIIPVYNRENLIGRSIESVLAQTYTDFEIVVVDDASTDNSCAVVEQYMEVDNRICLVRSDKNRGGGGARNLGIQNAKGDYVAFQDSDDEWLPGKLEFQMAEFSDDIGMCYHSVQQIYLDGKEGRIFPNPKEEESITKEEILKELVRGYHVGTQTMLVRTSILKDIGGFDESFPALQDREIAIRIAKKCSIAYIGRPLVKYYSNLDSISQNVSAGIIARLLFLDKYFADAYRYGVVEELCEDIVSSADRVGLLGQVVPMMKKILMLHCG